MSKIKNNNQLTLPKFDPVPSAEFAHNVLGDLGINGVLIGRLAVWTWLPDPSDHTYTKDFDLAIEKGNRLNVAKYLSDKNYNISELVIGGFNVNIPDENINVDFIDRYSEEEGDFSDLFQDAITKSNETVNIEGIEFKVVSIDHLAAMKIATMEKKDEEDAKNLLQSEKPDIERLRIIVKKFLGPVAKIRLEQILREIGHRSAQQRRKYKSGH